MRSFILFGPKLLLLIVWAIAALVGGTGFFLGCFLAPFKIGFLAGLEWVDLKIFALNERKKK